MVKKLVRLCPSLPPAVSLGVSYAPVRPLTIDVDVNIPVSLTGGGVPVENIDAAVGLKLHPDFKSAVTAMCTAAEEALRRCEVDISQVKCIIPHQANRRIIDAVADRLEARPDQVFVNVDKYGNTSAASVAIALDEAVQTGRIQRGDLVLTVVFGAGLTWGAALIEW